MFWRLLGKPSVGKIIRAECLNDTHESVLMTPD